MKAKELWASRFRFPTAIGALDCSHVKIEKPNLHGEEYINRKGEVTLNVQATCNAMYVFTSVDVSWPGSVHDSRIWKNSDVREVMRRTQNIFLIADQGYGIEPWLMTPYREPVNIDVKKAYNKLLSKERVVIEQCFGQIKRRFPILKYCFRVKLTNVLDIIVACIILHNIAKALQDPDFEGSDEDQHGAMLLVGMRKIMTTYVSAVRKCVKF
ncbi:unnamed protein product [Acanthoscelides obtectus]|uniref:DDE Tnp4 domain-containing protein n=1 Tax=Acanthoscelides obtectus TaxID=200917 RepID=A0A9P0PNQ8_ACAOB|nr:unnamed protein product [Acanthoscelides obtectus]CAK1680663.1 Putative nuclease HARBI1 [Acanthoscelides obtectus]